MGIAYPSPQIHFLKGGQGKTHEDRRQFGAQSRDGNALKGYQLGFLSQGDENVLVMFSQHYKCTLYHWTVHFKRLLYAVLWISPDKKDGQYGVGDGGTQKGLSSQELSSYEKRRVEITKLVPCHIFFLLLLLSSYYWCFIIKLRKLNIILELLIAERFVNCSPFSSLLYFLF